MKGKKVNAKDEKGTNQIIQRKEGKSFVKPKGAQDSFTPPKSSGKSNKSLPSKLQSNMESSLGHDFSNVGIHTNSEKAVQMNARAFTQGEQVHFAPGEFNPSSTSGKNLIGHEFTHVAQQRAGVVKPTKVLQKGVAINDNKGLESEADNFGQKAARGEAVSKYRSSSLGIRSSLRTAQAKSNVVQMAMQETNFGKFYDDTYALTSGAGGRRGLDIILRFEPKNTVDAELIGLTQTHHAINNGTPFYLNSDNFYKGHAIQSGDATNLPDQGVSNEGTHIDRLKARNNPIYGSRIMNAGETLKDTPLDNNTTANPTKVGLTKLDPTSNATYQLGYNYTDAGGTHKNKAAILSDAPSVGSVNMSSNSSQIFETTALAIKGNHEGTYYGSVRWGWKTNAKGLHSIIPFKVLTKELPSPTFMKAAKIWNNSKNSAGADTLDLPVQWPATIHNTPLAALRTGKSVASQILADIPRGATLTVLNDSSNWLHVQLDKTQPGIILNSHGRAAVMSGNLIRGYVSRSLVNKDASYI
ncbi:hypothetical protein IMCC3317_02580 [Kordia antarctica]|uniref:eCIS core domain-containing protein n=1 Tax=Kordia antarctica TaxID=1218801 RepID=A0A7L4ZDT9_9FLAO|nr:DUF4157 domain-containing protein [Kordia antarctica]QHI34913.1 hypothetical protein IMCC3317_02580 [Kordia antarctica]